ncbi:MAG: DinB family protein [Spirochaetes bacterium]|nr:DinB family protein [Spirochaetota bacterium]
MSQPYDALMDLADAEFDGRSFNGKPLMKTLDALPARAAASTETFEGYSAWEVALHCLYYKYFAADALGAAGPLEPYPYPKGNFVPPPATTEADWTEFRAYLRTAHAVCGAAVRNASPEALDALIPDWKLPVRAIVPWLASHDSYHVAQIRSMGVPGLKEPKAT